MTISRRKFLNKAAFTSAFLPGVGLDNFANLDIALAGETLGRDSLVSLNSSDWRKAVEEIFKILSGVPGVGPLFSIVESVFTLGNQNVLETV